MDKITFKEAQEFKAAMAEHPENNGQLVLQENGEIRLDARHRAMGTPVRQYNQADISFDLGLAHGTATAIKDFVNSAPIRELLTAVHAGHEVAWNGRNHAGSLTPDARKAYAACYNAFEDRMQLAAEKAFKPAKRRDGGR